MAILGSNSALATRWINVSGSLWFNSSAALVHGQLVCFYLVGILYMLSLFELFGWDPLPVKLIRIVWLP